MVPPCSGFLATSGQNHPTSGHSPIRGIEGSSRSLPPGFHKDTSWSMGKVGQRSKRVKFELCASIWWPSKSKLLHARSGDGGRGGGGWNGRVQKALSPLNPCWPGAYPYINTLPYPPPPLLAPPPPPFPSLTVLLCFHPSVPKPILPPTFVLGQEKSVWVSRPTLHYASTLNLHCFNYVVLFSIEHSSFVFLNK